MPEMKRRTIRLAVLSAVLLVGVGVGMGASRLSVGEHATPGVSTPTPAADVARGAVSAGDPDALATLPQLGQPITADQATSPEQAVSGFLTAEARGDFPGSYAFLATSEHAKFETPAFWVQAHGHFPVVTGFRVEGSTPEGQGVRVTTLTGYQPNLDEILGLTTARARSGWLTAQEGGVWRVVFSARTNKPLYPGDAEATEVAQRWAAQRIACEPTDQLEAALKGAPFLAESLCHAKGELRLGNVAPLSQLDYVTPFISAYGPDVLTWARAVPITSPQQMQVVLAPVGADWKIMGVIRQTATR
jgi:hypothetical protein